MDELVEQFVAYFAHWSEEAQPKIFRGHVAEKIGIEGSIFRLEPADQNRRSIAQDQVWPVKCHTAVSAPARDASSGSPRLVNIAQTYAAINQNRSAACPLWGHKRKSRLF